ncbi:hypothetical protein EVAR_19390_1 [Eumeta japonica]|uniref:Uncharacterized protein n=1 Tax=Eumeta variegata TaxID=151549 RepID=A0A4C1TRI4_EUMVA|nr:hypothetical protein EVAR_19390_1 [Eumeta japonica]
MPTPFCSCRFSSDPKMDKDDDVTMIMFERLCSANDQHGIRYLAISIYFTLYRKNNGGGHTAVGRRWCPRRLTRNVDDRSRRPRNRSDNQMSRPYTGRAPRARRPRAVTGKRVRHKKRESQERVETEPPRRLLGLPCQVLIPGQQRLK